MDSTVVRTITIFLPSLPADDPTLNSACTLAKTLRTALESHNITVQTTRIAFPSPSIFGTASTALKTAQTLDSIDIDYISLGTIRPDDPSEFHSPDFVLSLFRNTQKTFISTTITSSSTLSLPLIRSAANIIQNASTIDSSGIVNMRYAAISNVPPGTPFFPASYACKQSPLSVALGIQGASLLSDVPNITSQVESRAEQLLDICKPYCEVKLDFSFAPLPGSATSTAGGISQWADCTFGAPGTLAAAATVATMLDRAKFPRAGFCGIMLPVAEDSELGGVSVNELLMLSAVCGVGLDVS